MRRKLILLLVAGCLLALAGCTGGLTDDEPTLEDASYPDGVSDNGTNVSALADAHAEGLENRSFTLALDLSENGSETNQSASVRASVGADRDQIRTDVTGTDMEQSVYLTAEKRYVRSMADGEPTYRVSDRSPQGSQFVPGSYSGASYLQSFAAAPNANFTPTGVQVVNGTTLIELEADGSNVSAPGTEVTNYEATMLVDEQGVVHRFEVTAQTESEGDEQSVSLSMELSNVDDTSVEEPAWLDEAKNQSSD